MDENEPAQLREIIKISEVKFDEILRYCEPHVHQMWAATVMSFILGCDFRDVIPKFAEYKAKK